MRGAIPPALNIMALAKFLNKEVEKAYEKLVASKVKIVTFSFDGENYISENGNPIRKRTWDGAMEAEMITVHEVTEDAIKVSFKQRPVKSSQGTYWWPSLVERTEDVI